MTQAQIIFHINHETSSNSLHGSYRQISVYVYIYFIDGNKENVF